MMWHTQAIYIGKFSVLIWNGRFFRSIVPFRFVPFRSVPFRSGPFRSMVRTGTERWRKRRNGKTLGMGRVLNMAGEGLTCRAVPVPAQPYLKPNFQLSTWFKCGSYFLITSWIYHVIFNWDIYNIYVYFPHNDTFARPSLCFPPSRAEKSVFASL